ncbi:protein toll [Dendroctonus ponderosae]|uniref:protein toll n=1 Tax=Dendroctonus ponderosae TaxID=77166 RepID=UPI002035BE44|nr:protein toll [Dendroctonus ponderosae]KAH1028903.1 hypothetical protein HUJ05_002222 [Dendroctonus ponderosae]
MNFGASTFTLLVLLVASIAQTLSIDCSIFGRNMCLCQHLETELLQCPPAEPKIIISISDKQHITVQCQDEVTPNLDLDLFPDLNITQCQQFKLEYCYPENGFDGVRKKFGVQNLTVLELESMAPKENSASFSLTKDFLGNLSSLESLRISYSPISFAPDFLANFPNLLALVIYKSEISQLHRHFDYVPKLTLLDLASNQISALPDGVFRSLTNLSRLQLFSNNISSISRRTFEGLENVKLLELSLNHISQVAEDSFADLPLLVNLSLRGNRIQTIESNIFAHNSLLENVRLGSNPGVIFQDRVFENLTKLLTVELNSNRFQTLPEGTFTNCRALKDINLSSNLLSSLPEGVFRNLRYLKRLNLSFNTLGLLPDTLFVSLESLEQLELSHNQLSAISRQLFKPLHALKQLHLSHNQLSIIDKNAFSSLQSQFTVLDLSFNNWNNSYDVPVDIFQVTPLAELLYVEQLLLSHNQLRWIPDLPSALKLRRLDLSYNNISNVSMQSFAHHRASDLEIDLTHNQIEQVDFKLAETALVLNLEEDAPKDPSNIFKLSNNPLVCDCRNYDLARFSNGEMKHMKWVIRIDLDDQTCVDDSAVKVAALTPSMVNCPMPQACPARCSCAYKPFFRAALVNCSHQNLSSYPEFDLQSDYDHRFNQTWLDLSGNNFTKSPSKEVAYSSYSNVTWLDLSANSLQGIDWISPQVEVLNLNNNSIQNLDENVVAQLKNCSRLRLLKLKNNPWKCSCQSLELQKYIMEYYHKVNSSDVYCSDSQMQLVKLTELCTVSALLSVLLPIVLSVLLCFSVAVALYYRYQTEIKVYLFAKNLCLWFVTEEELDKNKTYDVFVSYAHQDENFVMEHLLPELEQRENPFKVCIHIRDWIPGEFIAEQVVSSVKDSRRTLVVLSNNFVDSVWGKLEFRTAHTEAITEGRARVIVVIYGDLDETKLDGELKSYLKTNTYVKWGDRYFWNKLRYALPHSHGNFYEKNKRHANVMLKIDDKFELIKNPPSPSTTSTPPITLDPALLQNQVGALPVEGEAPLLVRS